MSDSIIHIGYQPLDVHLPFHRSAARYKAAIGGYGPQSVDTPVLTPTGWRRLGDLRPGDRVIGSSGRPTTVEAVHPQGLLSLFRVTFSDGGSTLACENHRWTVMRRSRRRDFSRPARKEGGRMRHPEVVGRDAVTVGTLKLRTRRERGNSAGNYPDALPLLPPVEFANQPAPPIDPYALGALLGDGGMTHGSCSFTTADEELDAALRAVLDCGERRQSAGQAWHFGVRGVVPRLRALGLQGLRSEHKHVPEVYRLGTAAVRQAVLQGLMDTDGSSGGNTNEFCSTSWRLARDVQELAWSLGCTAKLSSSPSYLNGQRHLDRHRVYIVPPVGLELFRLARKPTYRPTQTRYGRYVQSVVPEGAGPAVCITVSAADGLYVTEDYIITHNSGKSVALCQEALMFALEQPGSDMALMRKFAPDLKDSTEAIFLECMPQGLLDQCSVRKTSGHIGHIQFPNGSLLKFKGCDDWTKHKSQNLSWIGFDEADEQSEANVVGMASRLRQTAPLKAAVERGYETHLPMRRQVCLATNPNGKDWIWKCFVNHATKWANAEAFISTTLDNPHLPIDFVNDQMSRDLQYIKRYVLCLFEEQTGAIYPDWSRSHVVKWAPKADTTTEIWHSVDPGTTRINPTAAGWFVVDRTAGRLVQIAEYSAWDLPATKHADNWRRIEARLPGRVVWRTGDPNTLAARDRGSNMRLMDIYRRLGFSFVPGPVTHKIRVPALGELISMGRFVVTESCPSTYDQIEGYRWEDQLPSHIDLGEYREVVKKGNDHLVDVAQYAAARWVLRHSVIDAPPDKTPEQLFADHVRATIRKNLIPSGPAPGVIT